jgi:hypothetical protein
MVSLFSRLGFGLLGLTGFTPPDIVYDAQLYMGFAAAIGFVLYNTQVGCGL